jgi:RecJ-like exonuclease
MVSKGLSSNKAMSLLGKVYTLTHEEPWTPLRDAREFSVLLNATGRMNRSSLGIAICMGDREAALKEADSVLNEYRQTITRYLNWIMEPKMDRIQEQYKTDGGNKLSLDRETALKALLEIAQDAPIKPILRVAEECGILPEELVYYGAAAQSVLRLGLEKLQWLKLFFPFFRE